MATFQLTLNRLSTFQEQSFFIWQNWLIIFLSHYQNINRSLAKTDNVIRTEIYSYYIEKVLFMWRCQLNLALKGQQTNKQIRLQDKQICFKTALSSPLHILKFPATHLTTYPSSHQKQNFKTIN